MTIDGVDNSTKANNAEGHGKPVQDSIHGTTFQENWHVIFFLWIKTDLINFIHVKRFNNLIAENTKICLIYKMLSIILKLLIS